MTQPPFLKRGDLIGITCPAGYLPAEKAAACIQTLKNWGYQVVTGETVGGNSGNYFSADDETRARELQVLLDDKKIKAILFGRGGYGMTRIIDRLDFKKFRKNPKWLIGFSDITVMHTHLMGNYKTASLHAPMAAAFNEDNGSNEYLLSLQQALAGKKARYTAPPHPFNQTGKAKGILVGGNLALLAHVMGTTSDFETKNRIFFLEDIGEYLYNVDRMLQQLKRGGKFDKIAGLILGGFSDMKDTERPYGKTIDEILQEYTTTLNCPVCLHFPVSHEKENLALKTGGRYELKVQSSGAELNEL